MINGDQSAESPHRKSVLCERLSVCSGSIINAVINQPAIAWLGTVKSSFTLLLYCQALQPS